jgi:hypothetical protein
VVVIDPLVVISTGPMGLVGGGDVLGLISTALAPAADPGVRRNGITSNVGTKRRLRVD